MFRSYCVAFALCVGLVCSPIQAHHSFAAEYDANQPLVIKGAVNRVDWVNPHSWVYVDVTGADGKVVTWKCETAPPNGLFRRGWTKSSLKKGEIVSVDGFRAKDGSATMNARSVTLPDGRKMFAGSSGDGAPVREGEDQK
ncbi:MAG: hypothetical protein RL328_2755 [Acidobacteriota bacterium]|jgi:hypothetical protein